MPVLRRFRLDVWEAVCVGAFLTFVGFLAGRAEIREMAPWGVAGRAELEPIRRKYGPVRFSTGFEEWLVRDYFQERRGGFFVDVGAGDYRHGSNTYYLEKELGWSGIAVDALAQFEPGFRRHRPRTKFVLFFVSDASDQQVQFHVLDEHPWVSSADRNFTRRWGRDTRTVTVPTATLNDILAAEGVERIDFLSMDVELSEPKALAGFDVGRYRPALVCIEAHPEVRQSILEFFTTRRYVLVGRFLRADVSNFYFAPLSK